MRKFLEGRRGRDLFMRITWPYFKGEGVFSDGLAVFVDVRDKKCVYSPSSNSSF